MRVTEAKFARKFNTGNYESEEYSLTAIVEDSETGSQVLSELKERVLQAFEGRTTTDPKNSVVSDDDEDEVETHSQLGNDVEDEAPALEASSDDEEEDEEEVEEKPAAKFRSKKSKTATAGTSGKTKAKKPKTQTYDRGNDTHKALFTEVLREVSPSWNKTEAGKAKGKKASIELEGEEFLDADGEVLETFRAQVKKLLGGKK